MDALALRGRRRRRAIVVAGGGIVVESRKNHDGANALSGLGARARHLCRECVADSGAELVTGATLRAP